MRQIREVLRLKYECGLNQWLISASVGISKGSVSDYLARAARAGLTWSEANLLDEAEVEQRLFAQIGRNEPASDIQKEEGRRWKKKGRGCTTGHIGSSGESAALRPCGHHDPRRSAA